MPRSPAGWGRRCAARARRSRSLPVEVECRNLDEVRQGAEAGADRLLLDNMSPAELREAVAAARRVGTAPSSRPRAAITLENVAEIAATGVDFVSVGALTHSAPALDLSMTLAI